MSFRIGLLLVVAVLCICGSSVEVSPSSALAKEERSGKSLTEEEMMQIAIFESIKDELARIERAAQEEIRLREMLIDQKEGALKILEGIQAEEKIDDEATALENEGQESVCKSCRARNLTPRILFAGALIAALTAASSYLPDDSLDYIKKGLGKEIAAASSSLIDALFHFPSQLQEMWTNPRGGRRMLRAE